jgi:hypothetical protein
VLKPQAVCACAEVADELLEPSIARGFAQDDDIGVAFLDFGTLGAPGALATEDSPAALIVPLEERYLAIGGVGFDGRART